MQTKKKRRLKFYPNFRNKFIKHSDQQWHPKRSGLIVKPFLEINFQLFSLKAKLLRLARGWIFKVCLTLFTLPQHVASFANYKSSLHLQIEFVDGLMNKLRKIDRRLTDAVFF